MKLTLFIKSLFGNFDYNNNMPDTDDKQPTITDNKTLIKLDDITIEPFE